MEKDPEILVLDQKILRYAQQIRGLQYHMSVLMRIKQRLENPRTAGLISRPQKFQQMEMFG